MVGDKTSERLHLLPTLVDGRPEPGGPPARRRGGHARGAALGAAGEADPARRKLYTPAPGRGRRTPRRARTCCPPIYFIFSRNRCDEAAKSVPRRRAAPDRRGDERDRIRADRRCAASTASATPTSTCSATPRSWRSSRPGIAAHHAGMVPPFKEVVEACFTEGLVKVVFATETLAVGINMPARSVVIEKLTKFTGEHHAFLTPGEYTQLTGRAGRRGIDDVGRRDRAVEPVRALRPGGRAGVESLVPPALRVPTDLQHGRQPRALATPASRPTTCSTCSFAQYQADREVVKHRDPPRAAPGAPRRAARRGREPVRRHRRVPGHAGRRPTGRRRRRSDETVEAALSRLRPGDVHPRREGALRGRSRPCSPSPTARAGCGSRVVTTAPRHVADWRATTSTSRRRRSAQIELPRPFAPEPPDFQRRSSHALRSGTPRAALAGAPAGGRHGRRRRRPTTARRAAPPGRGRPRSRRPAAGRRGRPSACRAGGRRPARRVRGHNQSMARAVRPGAADPRRRGATSTAGRSPTPGEILARTFHECDLLIVECLRRRAARRPRPVGARRAGVGASPTSTARSEPPPAAVVPLAARPQAAGTGSTRISAELSAARSGRRPDPAPRRRTRRSSRSPTPGRRVRASPRWSRTRSSPAATSCAT